MTSFPAITFIGTGSMARAIITGLLASGADITGGITTTNRSQAAAAVLKHELITSLASEADEPGQATANQRAVSGAGLVVLAVKPGMVVDVLREICGHLEPDTVLISVAAGVPLRVLRANVPDSVAVVRAMPNTPALVGKGVTGLAFEDNSSPRTQDLAVSLFNTVGVSVTVPESQIDALSAISGSGPAYVFYLIEKLTEVAEAKGFDRETAKTMVEGTFRGSSELLASSEYSPRELRLQVTSPNGTTERAIAAIEQADFAKTFTDAVDGAMYRAKQLAAEAG